MQMLHMLESSRAGWRRGKTKINNAGQSQRATKKCYSIIYGVLCIVFCQRTDNLPVVKACDLSLVATFASPHTQKARQGQTETGREGETSPCGGFGWQMSTADDVQAQAGYGNGYDYGWEKRLSHFWRNRQICVLLQQNAPQQQRQEQSMCSHGTCISMQ